jgi:hypothetical protein
MHTSLTNPHSYQISKLPRYPAAEICPIYYCYIISGLALLPNFNELGVFGIWFFLQIPLWYTTGSDYKLNWTVSVFCLFSVCSSMIIGRAQKMPACDWLQYYHQLPSYQGPVYKYNQGSREVSVHEESLQLPS